MKDSDKRLDRGRLMTKHYAVIMGEFDLSLRTDSQTLSDVSSCLGIDDRFERTLLSYILANMYRTPIGSQLVIPVVDSFEPVLRRIFDLLCLHGYLTKVTDNPRYNYRCPSAEYFLVYTPSDDLSSCN
jgi:hypothetical protein